jgi:hypothetical protein
MKKRIIIGGAVLLLAGGVWLWFGLLQYGYPQRLHAKPRKEWKEAAILAIARRAGDPTWVAREIGKLKADATLEPSDPERWLSPGLILMTNGEWIAYSNVCSKQNWRIHDLFIGRASDDNWYYSTFHFCIGMVVLRGQGQPGSVAKFAEEYYLRRFDGQSDECLQETWPPTRK